MQVPNFRSSQSKQRASQQDQQKKQPNWARTPNRETTKLAQDTKQRETVNQHFLTYVVRGRRDLHANPGDCTLKCETPPPQNTCPSAKLHGDGQTCQWRGHTREKGGKPLAPAPSPVLLGLLLNALRRVQNPGRRRTWGMRAVLCSPCDVNNSHRFPR